MGIQVVPPVANVQMKPSITRYVTKSSSNFMNLLGLKVTFLGEAKDDSGFSSSNMTRGSAKRMLESER